MIKSEAESRTPRPEWSSFCKQGKCAGTKKREWRADKGALKITILADRLRFEGEMMMIHIYLQLFD